MIAMLITALLLMCLAPATARAWLRQMERREAQRRLQQMLENRRRHTLEVLSDWRGEDAPEPTTPGPTVRGSGLQRSRVLRARSI